METSSYERLLMAAGEEKNGASRKLFYTRLMHWPRSDTSALIVNTLLKDLHSGVPSLKLAAFRLLCHIDPELAQSQAKIMISSSSDAYIQTAMWSLLKMEPVTQSEHPLVKATRGITANGVSCSLDQLAKMTPFQVLCCLDKSISEAPTSTEEVLDWMNALDDFLHTNAPALFCRVVRHFVQWIELDALLEQPDLRTDVLSRLKNAVVSQLTCFNASVQSRLFILDHALRNNWASKLHFQPDDAMSLCPLTTEDTRLIQAKLRFLDALLTTNLQVPQTIYMQIRSLTRHQESSIRKFAWKTLSQLKQHAHRLVKDVERAFKLYKVEQVHSLVQVLTTLCNQHTSIVDFVSKHWLSLYMFAKNDRESMLALLECLVHVREPEVAFVILENVLLENLSEKKDFMLFKRICLTASIVGTLDQLKPKLESISESMRIHDLRWPRLLQTLIS